jgi:hypothetical protein
MAERTNCGSERAVDADGRERVRRVSRRAPSPSGRKRRDSRRRPGVQSCRCSADAKSVNAPFEHYQASLATSSGSAHKRRDTMRKLTCKML